LHFGHGATDAHNAVESKPVVTTVVPHDGSFHGPTNPLADDGPKTETPKKKSIMDEPLGEDRPQTQTQPASQPQPQSDKTDSDRSENITTGDSHATGNDSSTDDGTGYEVSDSGGNTAIGNDSGDTTDTTQPQRTDDGSRQRTEDRPPQEDPSR